MSVEILTSFATVVGVCIVAVNIIVEVLKSFWLKAEASKPLAVIVVSEFMAFFVTFTYCNMEGIAFSFMIGIGAFAGGFFIAYGAMFGYDKLYGELFERLKGLLK